MKLKSLLIAATMVGGLALGASAASAQVYQYTITGADTSLDGTFYADENSALPFSTINSAGTGYANAFYTAFGGTGAYTGVNMVSFSPLSNTLGLFDDSTPLPYVINFGTNPATIVGSVDTIAVSAAPEPGVWLLMIAGVAMIGSALRFSRKQGALAVA
jgi:hypothetical protein